MDGGKIKKMILTIFFGIATIAALCGLYIIVIGSLEMFPTEEQLGKAHMFGWVILLAGVFIDGIIGMIMIKSHGHHRK